jgi:hypothetical protein
MSRIRVCAVVLGVMLSMGLVAVVQAQGTIDVDVKPGSDENPVNIKSQGSTPIAVLCTPVVNPLQVAGAIITAGAGSVGEKCRLKDVDEDGCQDVLCHFPTPELGVTCETTDLEVVVTLNDGTTLTGSDTVTPKPCKPGKE